MALIKTITAVIIPPKQNIKLQNVSEEISAVVSDGTQWKLIFPVGPNITTIITAGNKANYMQNLVTYITYKKISQANSSLNDRDVSSLFVLV